ncbi:MAG: LamG domain-containing protein [Promethearchaeota archaeon]
MLTFNGSNYIETINNFTVPATVSVSLWLLATYSTGSQYFLGSNVDFKAFIQNTTNLYFYFGGSTNKNKTLTNDVWYHIAACFSDTANTIDIYVDGVLEHSEIDQNDTPGVGTMRFGWSGDQGNPNTKFYGSLDDIRIYNRILTLGEIKTIYYSRGKENILDGLINWWPLQEYSNGTVASGTGAVKDIIGGNHATPTGDPIYGNPITEIGGRVQ